VTFSYQVTLQAAVPLVSYHNTKIFNFNAYNNQSCFPLFDEFSNLKISIPSFEFAPNIVTSTNPNIGMIQKSNESKSQTLIRENCFWY